MTIIYDGCIIFNVTAEGINKLYKKLSDESHPFQMNVCKGNGKGKTIKLYFQKKDREYYRKLVESIKL